MVWFLWQRNLALDSSDTFVPHASRNEVTVPGILRGGCAKAERFRDSAERPIDGPDLRAVRGEARGNELSIDEADAFGKQAPSFDHVSHVRRAYGW